MILFTSSARYGQGAELKHIERVSFVLTPLFQYGAHICHVNFASFFFLLYLT